ncbi:MAG: UDP-N-acetylmuramoyl-L-alanyl-D-glutamate--2,6-diaminopimelate ligase [bacterium]|nr:UDP-N-acetylmuramoyl-L-alanyl-D-glutamate--2,6-diaminopimelate ligase [bacterium]
MAFLRLIPGAEHVGDPDAMIVDVTTDSRLVQPGWAFVAVKGDDFDGNEAIADAIASGAVVVVGEGKYEAQPGVVMVTVPNARLAFARMVNAYMDEPSRGLRFFGVTGTNGKTTVATILEQIYKASGRETAFIGTTGVRYHDVNIDTGFTTPELRTLNELFYTLKKSRIDSVFMEVSSHALHQHRIEGVAFHGAIFTNLTHDHLDYHGTMEEYALTKKLLFDRLTLDAIAVVNGEDPMAAYMVKDCKARRVITVGEGDTNVIEIDDIVCNTLGISYSMCLPPAKRGGAPLELHFRSPLIGRFNVINTALCAAMAIHDGIPHDVVIDAIRNITSPSGRMERYPLINGAVAVVDYAHTPDALQNALKVLREILPSGAKLHVVFGCGGARDKSKRKDMGRVAAELADRVYITSDNPRTENPQFIVDCVHEGTVGVTKKGPGRRGTANISAIVDRRNAIRKALDTAKPQDIVLIAGKGHETYQIIGTDRMSFSDVNEVAAWNADHRKKPL